MRKEILAEDFMNASKEYSEFINAMFDRYEDDPIMQCLLSNLNHLANKYYMSMIRIYNNGMTLDEAIKLNERGEQYGKI